VDREETSTGKLFARLFSDGLAIQPINDPEENLRALAKLHAELSGVSVNWLGTYPHAEKI
jgi:hypothetical protein